MRRPCTATESSPRALQLEKACAQQRRPNAAKNLKKNKNKKQQQKKLYCLSLKKLDWTNDRLDTAEGRKDQYTLNNTTIETT